MLLIEKHLLWYQLIRKDWNRIVVVLVLCDRCHIHLPLQACLSSESHREGSCWITGLRKNGHTLFHGPVLAINKPLTMTFASINSWFAAD